MTAYAAFWFLPAVIPIAIYVSWSDMSSMKITNKSVMALVIVYAVLGPFAFGLDMYLWQWLHLPIALAVCILLWAARLMGAGDAKFIAAAAPMLVMADLNLILRVFAASLIAALIVHRLAKRTPVRAMVPDWKSWEDRRFPKGLPLSMTLVFYLALVATYR